MILGMVLATALMAAAPAEGGALPEPTPPGAPSDPYELTAWCYGALGEYLTIYEQVIPDLQAIDRQFGTSVVEDKPYSADVAAAREALVRFGKAMEAAERASVRPIAERGALAIQRGRALWARAETQPRRQLARAWLYWGVPDQCDTTAQALYQRSILAAPALAYNTTQAPTAAAPAPAAPPPPAPSASSEIRMPANAPGVFSSSLSAGGSTPLSAQIAATLPRTTTPPPPAAPPVVVASAARPARIIENDEGPPPAAKPTVPVSSAALPLIAPPAPVAPAAPPRAAPAPAPTLAPAPALAPAPSPPAATSPPITTAVRPAAPTPAPPAAAPAPTPPAAVVRAPTPLGPVSSDEPMEPLM